MPGNEQDSKSGPVTVVLVESNGARADSFRFALETPSLEVARLCSADEAVSYVRAGNPADLAVVNSQLDGGIDGWEAAELIRRTHPELPLLLYADEENLEAGDRREAIGGSGAIEIVTTSTGDGDLAGTVRRILADGVPAGSAISAGSAVSAGSTVSAPADATTDHYLKRELYELVRSDDSIFEFLQSGSLDGIWYWDLEQQQNEWMSPRFWEVLGENPDEKVSSPSEWQHMIDPADLAVALGNLKAHLADPNHPYDQLVRYHRKDGKTVWVRCRGLAIRDAEGNPIRLLGAHNDVTELKEAEAELVTLLETKDRLMAELNHRVKNSIAVISSLVELKEHSTEGLDLSDLKAQLAAVRSVHEELNQAEEGLTVDLSSYLPKLVQTVFEGLGASSVEQRMRVPPLRIHAREAAALGIIVNEAATNAVKHAYRAGRAEWFEVSVSPAESIAGYRVSISNSGPPIGKPDKTDRSSSLGLELMSGLATQLRGKLEISGEPHTRLSFTFPESLLVSPKAEPVPSAAT
jgi:PAS domain S-box-containing protein